jgi:hypothetical protein
MRIHLFESVPSMIPPGFVTKWLWAVVRWWILPIVLSVVIAKIVLITWAPLPDNFYVWWLTGLVFFGSRESMRLSKDRTILWKGIIIPVGFSGALILLITYASHKLSQAPTQGLLLFCAVGSCGFLIFTVFWVILFPFERGLTHTTSRLSIYWKAVCGVLGLPLIIYFVRQTVELLNLAKRPGTFALSILVVQSHAVQGSILIFFLFVLRVWMPKASVEFAKATRATVSPKL